MAQPTIAFVATDSEEAEAARIRLEEHYASVSPQKADIIVALGGDGFVLETLHRYLAREVPIYGMNCGTVGFLMNLYDEEGLVERLVRAECQTLHPLRMTARTQSGEEIDALAINEVSLFRESRQAAKLRIKLDGVTRMEELICDGALVSTAAGSTAYNLSAQGPIIPLGTALLALTPISAFRPRRWRGALLPKHTEVTFEVLEARKRPVGAVADFTEVRDVIEVKVREDDGVVLKLLFDPEHNLEERVIKEQFQA